MRNAWHAMVLLLTLSHAQITIRIQIRDGKDFTEEKLATALTDTDLAIAGEPFSSLVTYEDSVVGLRSLEGQCAAGYFWDTGTCNLCPCVTVQKPVSYVRFAPLTLTTH